MTSSDPIVREIELAALEPGKTYVLQTREDLSDREIDRLMELLRPVRDETGCHFLILSGGVEFVGERAT